MDWPLWLVIYNFGERKRGFARTRDLCQAFAVLANTTSNHYGKHAVILVRSWKLKLQIFNRHLLHILLCKHTFQHKNWRFSRSKKRGKDLKTNLEILKHSWEKNPQVYTSQASPTRLKRRWMNALLSEQWMMQILNVEQTKRDVHCTLIKCVVLRSRNTRHSSHFMFKKVWLTEGD